MSDIFGSDIYNQAENLSSLEDNDISVIETENIVFDYPLYQIKLEYSSETLYANLPENLTVKAGDYVITPSLHETFPWISNFLEQISSLSQEVK